MDMETRAPNLQLDLICETLGVSLETLAEYAGVTPGELSKKVEQLSMRDLSMMR